ncbi:ABC transporter permease [Rhizobium sp. CG5]|uniref:ABC transporter permease n=1 Tax=Rhizobium sp. CG5 TaxID=2726076 RepID=UPI00203370FB|nr:ABC transporter permease [Rhizobium sp. CG5]MCM2477383.1 ABC transporter permease [Rhizobium sp. CG5]
MTVKLFDRSWWQNDNSESQTQAAWVHRYRLWVAFYGNRPAIFGLVLIGLVLLGAIFAPWLATHDPVAQNLGQRLLPPSTGNWLGTDELGRDVYSRLLYGGRVTLGMVLAVVVLVAPVGLLIGCAAGYYRGAADVVLMRVTDVFLAFPRLILALAFVAAIHPGMTSAVIAIALTTWPPYARLARAETMAIRDTDYIAAARMTGASSFRIIIHHVMPLCFSSLIVRVTLDMSSIVIFAASLGFLGMGAQPPMAEWGTMISSARRFILEQWWVPLIPGLAILTVSLAFNLVGDGLRDALDSRQN